MRKIAVINQKGGVGKTTTCCNLGAALASKGRSVLLIDLDPQAHLTMHLGVESGVGQPTIYDVLTDNTPIHQAIVQSRENLWLVPSHIDLAAAEMELVSVMGREVVLRDALEKPARDYDYLMIDCPPSLGVLTINGLAAVTEVFVPLQPHFLALQGVSRLLETISLVKSRINPALNVTGVILCMYEAGTKLANEVSTDVSSFLESFRDSDKPWAGARMFQTLIRRNIKLAECPSHGLTIFEYAPRSHGAADHARLAAEVDGDAGICSAENPFSAVPQDREGILGPASAVGDPGTDTQTAVREQSESAAEDSIPPFQAGSRVVTGPDDVPPAGTAGRDAAPAPAADQPASTTEPAASPVSTHD